MIKSDAAIFVVTIIPLVSLLFPQRKYEGTGGVSGIVIVIVIVYIQSSHSFL